MNTIQTFRNPYKTHNITCSQGMEKVTGISIINDTGINSDHVLVISKIDLGIKNFEIRKEHEERIDYKSIMNIPFSIKTGDTHPTISGNVYKGIDFRLHVKLYEKIQKT